MTTAATRAAPLSTTRIDDASVLTYDAHSQQPQEQRHSVLPEKMMLQCLRLRRMQPAATRAAPLSITTRIDDASVLMPTKDAASSRKNTATQYSTRIDDVSVLIPTKDAASSHKSSATQYYYQNR